MKFTKEEISLCKQIGEKHRKEVEYGDWFIMPADPHLFPTILESSPTHKLWKSEINKKAIPLWTISDCLEFLRKRGFSCFHVDFDGDEVTLAVDNLRDGISAKFLAKTVLATCLKAVLAVLEEEK